MNSKELQMRREPRREIRNWPKRGRRENRMVKVFKKVKSNR
jgi:hypothetical protein